MARFGDRLCVLTVALVLGTAAAAEVREAGADSDAWVDGLRNFSPGAGAGFGRDQRPWIVLGPPEGAGPLEGGVDVLSLGHGGALTVVFRDNVVVDGPGDDLVIFENAFYSGVVGGSVFEEYAFVQMSTDGRKWFAYPVDIESKSGLAGRTPVFANSINEIDPLSVDSGGDRFDLAVVGLPMIRYIRVIDAGDEIDDQGNDVIGGDNAGFDFDAAAAIHSECPGSVSGIVLNGNTPVPGVRLRLKPVNFGRKNLKVSAHDGRFRFPRVLPSGAYRLKAKWRGVARRTVDLRVTFDNADIDVTIDFQSEPSRNRFVRGSESGLP